FVIYISLPALVLLKIADLQFSINLILPVATAYVMLALSAAVVLFLSKAFKWNRQITGSLMLLVPLGNTSFLGLPMVYAFFGNTGMPYAVLYDQLGSFLMLAVYGTIILALYSNGNQKPGAKNILKKIVTFPPFLAVAAALLLRPIDYPLYVTEMLKVLEATLIPLVMVAIGFQTSFKIEKEFALPLTIGIILKLAALPALAILLSFIFGLKGEAIQVSIFEAAMPPMVSAGALAIIGGLAPRLSAALVGFGLILSFITLPLLYHLLTFLF
ncbi:MAG: AEC family transporter, partial [Ignavibacteriaceae bacterium]|nr:AEC family transporter [Ignavibacteriaceae bacterium]